MRLSTGPGCGRPSLPEQAAPWAVHLACSLLQIGKQPRAHGGAGCGLAGAARFETGWDPA